MNVSLSPELERFVAEKVESGLYQTASEVVRDGLRLLKQREEERSVRLQRLRNEIQTGLDQLDRGEKISGSAVFGEIRDMSLARRRG